MPISQHVDLDIYIYRKLVKGDGGLSFFEFTFVKNNVCEVFDGIERKIFHEVLEFGVENLHIKDICDC